MRTFWRYLDLSHPTNVVDQFVRECFAACPWERATVTLAGSWQSRMLVHLTVDQPK